MQRIDRQIPWIVAGVGTLATITVLYPGQYSFDSAYQLWQARTGRFNDLSPVAMAALWSLLLEISANPATLFCLNLAMYWIGMALCVMAISENTPVRVALLFAFGIAPLTLVEMAHLLSDAHLAAVLVLATGLAAWGLVASRTAPLLACILTLAYAGCVRHNALIAILPYGAVLALALVPLRDRDWRVAFTGALVLGVLSSAAGFALDRALVLERMTVWPTIALWDLAAISVDRNALLLPAFTHGSDLTVDELRETGAFDPTSNTFLFQKSHSGMRDGLGEPYSPGQLVELRQAWVNAVRQYPEAYVRHRLRTFWLLIGPHRGEVQGTAYFVAHTQFRDNPPLPPAWTQTAQREFYAFAATLRASWIFAGLPYLLLDVLALILGWVRRDRPTARVALAISSGALLYAASFLPLAPSSELRYLTWPIIAGPLALAFALSRRSRVSRDDPFPNFRMNFPTVHIFLNNLRTSLRPT